MQGVHVFSLAGCQWDAACTSVHKFENAQTLRVLVLDGCNIQVLHLDGGSDLRVLQVWECMLLWRGTFVMYVYGDAIDHVYLLCTISKFQALGCKNLHDIKEGLSDCTKLRRIYLSESSMVEVCICYY